MADSIVSFAIEKINIFLVQEIDIKIRVRDGLGWLKDELGYLLMFVRNAEATQESDDHISLWIDSVKDVANEAVIMLERFACYLEEKQAGSERGVHYFRCFSCIPEKPAFTYDIGHDIESLKEKVVDLKNRRDRNRIDEMVAAFYQSQEQLGKVKQQRTSTILRSTSFDNEVDVVGFKDEFNNLLAVINEGDPTLGYIAIHGMAGSGKSTLVSKLYHSSQLSHFTTRAWICVSQEYNIVVLLKKLIRSFRGEELWHEEDLLTLDEIGLLRHLRHLLLDANCSYLAVIDDLWNIEVWERIKRAFPDNKGSRVIITTRNREIANGVDDKCFVQQLRFLKADESWELFSRRAKPTPDLEELGKELVEECGGLPLAIVALSGLLLQKNSYVEWCNVKDDMRKSKSREFDDILSLNMENLSFRLRQCFLYLARFPEDYTFGVDKIKMLWIAEEFISETDEGDGVVMEDVADYYLNELINHNMVQIVSVGGQVSVCSVHDLVHNLAIKKAREQKMLGILDLSKQNSSHVRFLKGQPRHVIHGWIGEYLNLLEPDSDDDLKLRSLAVINETRLVESEHLQSMYSRFKYLKVLDLTGVESNEIAEEIGDMILLKFLGLMGNTNNRPLIIPSTIGNLKRLQTIFGSGNSHYDFPSEIGELRKLRHLKIAHTTKNLNIGSRQTELQTLQVIPYKDWIRINTAKFSNLHTLSITDDASLNIPYSLVSVGNLRSLKTLALNFLSSSVIPTIEPLSVCTLLTTVTLKGIIRDASELRFLPHFVKNLTLHGSNFTEDPMPTLGNLSILAVLHLDKAYMGEVMVCGDNAFPRLQILKLEDFPNLEEWRVHQGAMPSLKAFEADGCEKLKMIPQRLEGVQEISQEISHAFAYLKFA